MRGEGLKDEARAHLAAVVRLDPKRAEAWKRLGYKKVGSRWVTEEQVAAEKAEAEAQGGRRRSGSRCWRSSRDAPEGPAQAGRGREGLGEVTDPRAVPSVWSVLGTGDAGHQAMAVQVLGQIDATRRRGPWRCWPSSASRPRSAAAPPRRSGAATPRVRRAADRPAPRADQVRGPAGRRPGLAGRPVRRGEAVQRPAALPPPADARA